MVRTIYVEMKAEMEDGVKKWDYDWQLTYIVTRNLNSVFQESTAVNADTIADDHLQIVEVLLPATPQIDFNNEQR